jgi:thioredoxin 1
MPLPLITKIDNRAHFAQLLQSNPGVFIIKFGAEWCGPCKLIEQDVQNYFNQMPDNVQCAIIDVDESLDVYAFLKSKKMVNGIPAILAYYKGNANYIPDDALIGADKIKLAAFMKACFVKATE